MRKTLLLYLIAFALVFSTSANAGELKPDLSAMIAASPSEKVSVIILFHEKPAPADISAIRSDGASVKYQYEIINAVAAQVPAQAADRIARRPFVRLVEPDYEVKLVLDKSARQIRADEVWSVGVTGRNVDVAVIDTGIHDEHPDLAVEKEIDYTGEGTDDMHGHGTHVAGIIASRDSIYMGIAHGSNLFNVKVLNKDGSGYGSDVIKGIEWAVDNGAEIISMSLGARVDPCDGTDALSQAVDKAVSRGVVAISAAGNSGPDPGTITSPGCSKNGIAIGAVDDNDNVPSWSSRGPTGDGRAKPDIVAPGAGIISTWKDGTFRSLSGTSMSAPHVSGVAALLLETDPSLNPDDVKNILRASAVDLGLDQNTQGAGRVDAYEAYIFAANVTKEPKNETEENRTQENKTFAPPGLEKRKKPELPPAFRRELPPAGVTPDSFAYGFKRFFENIDMFFAIDEEARAEKHVKYAELRLSEAKEMADKGKPEFVGDLLNEYEDNLERGNEISRIAQQAGKNATRVAELVAVATSIHLDVLEDVFQKAPEQARPSIQRAITSSKIGNEEALNVLEKARPEKAAEIHFRIAEKSLAKAQENAEEGTIENIGDLVEEYEDRINKSNRIAEIAKGLGNNITNVEQLVAEATYAHLEILSEVREKAPEQAKTAIERAIDASSRAGERATEALKEKELPGYIPERLPGPEEIKEIIPPVAKEKIPVTIPEREEKTPEVKIPERPAAPSETAQSGSEISSTPNEAVPSSAPAAAASSGRERP